MRTKQLLGILIVLVGFVREASGQVSEGGTPYSFTNSLAAPANYNMSVTITAPEYELLTDTLDGDTIITYENPIIGQLFPTALAPSTHGTWTTLANGDKVWRLRINANTGAYMMLVFNDFSLPVGTNLFIYSADQTQVLGAFTSENNNPQNTFTTTPIKGRDLILEYYEPSYVTEAEHLGIQSIGLVTGTYEEVLEKGFGDSQSCMINAKCSTYEGWCNERRSVALIIIIRSDNMMSTCTGTLVTNERRDGKPTFLTAFHCLDENDNNSISSSEQSQIQEWLFIFNYQSANCSNPSTEPTQSYSISGGSYLGAHKTTDYALIQLYKKPPKNYNSFYAGWSNDEDDMTETGVDIHHPKGDIKKISEWEKKISLLPNYWRVKYTAGSTQPGSSGSALFNSSGYIVGQLKMGQAECDNNKSDYFGKFHKSWDNHGLRGLLNPNGSSSTYISSMSGDETCKENWLFASGSDLHTSANVTFANMASLGTRQYDGVYNAKNTIVAQSVTILASTTVSFEAGKEVVLEHGFSAVDGSNFIAKIGDCERGCGNGFKATTAEEPEERMVIFDGPSSGSNWTDREGASGFDGGVVVYPNPNDGRFNIEIPFNERNVLAVRITDQVGGMVYETYAFDGKEIQLTNASAGIYFVSVVTQEKTYTQKIIIR